MNKECPFLSLFPGALNNSFRACRGICVYGLVNIGFLGLFCAVWDRRSFTGDPSATYFSFFSTGPWALRWVDPKVRKS